MILAVDIGNTRIKTAVFEADTMLDFVFFFKADFALSIKNILKKHPKIREVVVSSVTSLEKEHFSVIAKDVSFNFISREDVFPFKNLYKTPDTLGIDRMVLAAGATLLYPMRNRLVIDLGTCVTYDVVDQNDNYLGGAISAGLQLRYQSLHQNTAKLPLLEITAIEKAFADSTAEAIHSGIVNGLTYEIEGFIEEFKKKDPNFIIILTGGDTHFLARRLKNTIFADSNFLLKSLNQTFLYKLKND